MRTGKLNISRGSQLTKLPAEEPRLVLLPTASPPASEPSEDCQAQASAAADQSIGHRLDALERLARLRSLDMLTAAEFAAEKAFILGHRPDNLDDPLVPSAPPAKGPESGFEPSAGPSLAGRLFSWKFLPIGLVAGIGLSFGAQPQETMRFIDQALTVLGA